MKIADLRKAVIDNGNDFYFTYNRKKSGVESEVSDSVFSFEAWHGNKTKTYDDFDTLVNDKFFSGKSIADLLEIVEIDFT